ncbi:MAG TPA: tRNA (guanosine(46)-N7)-methyltransferase TrmB [Cytophagales bacterium]|nr:tRNA (guanosine(46)-N7)-methyltransferase TrmB [Cytophagales bacterium]
MARQKLKRFAENAITETVIEPGKELFSSIKGNWSSDFFYNSNPITLELGCGYGEYSVGLAKLYPNKNFVGVDIKGSRIWQGSTLARENGLTNVGFLRTKIQNIENFFAEDEVSEIWITFPDPRPKNRDRRRRLTSPRMLEIYRKIIAANGIIHLKTDSRELMDYTLESLFSLNITPIQNTFDLYKEVNHQDIHYNIKTKYENIYLAENKPINYVKFNL